MTKLYFVCRLLFCYVKMVQIYAEVVTHVACSLEAGGLPGYPECLFVEINMMKSWQSSLTLYGTRIMKTRGLKLYTKCLHVREWK